MAATSSRCSTRSGRRRWRRAPRARRGRPPAASPCPPRPAPAPSASRSSRSTRPRPSTSSTTATAPASPPSTGSCAPRTSSSRGGASSWPATAGGARASRRDPGQQRPLRRRAGPRRATPAGRGPRARGARQRPGVRPGPEEAAPPGRGAPGQPGRRGGPPGGGHGHELRQPGVVRRVRGRAPRRAGGPRVRRARGDRPGGGAPEAGGPWHPPRRDDRGAEALCRLLAERDVTATGRTIAPYGSWRSSITVDALLAERVDPRGGGVPANEVVTVPLGAEGSPPAEPVVLVSGDDFYGPLRLSPDGRRLAWLAWSLPDMPWDGSQLRLAELDAPG